MGKKPISYRQRWEKKKGRGEQWKIVKKMSSNNQNHRSWPSNDTKRKSKQTMTVQKPQINQSKAVSSLFPSMVIITLDRSHGARKPRLTTYSDQDVHWPPHELLGNNRLFIKDRIILTLRMRLLVCNFKQLYNKVMLMSSELFLFLPVWRLFSCAILHFYTPPHDSGGVLWVHVGVSGRMPVRPSVVRPSMFSFRTIT